MKKKKSVGLGFEKNERTLCLASLKIGEVTVYLHAVKCKRTSYFRVSTHGPTGLIIGGSPFALEDALLEFISSVAFSLRAADVVGHGRDFLSS
jgi:hypothetical protein